VDPTGIIYLIGVALAYAFFWRRSPGRASKALAGGSKSFTGMLPTFIAVFGLVGLFETFIPPALIERLMGSSSGALSLLVGTALGTVATGPPAGAYPIAATLLKGGAWAPAVAAFIVSWILVGFVSLPMESRVFGVKFAVLRNGISILASMVIGVLMGVVL
jgi:uncharacterized membrane protein YraQ (UPF0718 family)